MHKYNYHKTNLEVLFKLPERLLGQRNNGWPCVSDQAPMRSSLLTAVIYSH